MKFSLLVLALCGIFTATAFAAVPTIDFNWNPYPSPLVFGSVTFDPTIVSSPVLDSLKWSFGSDGNVNYTATSEYVIDENFSNGNLSTPYVWTTGSGSFSESGGLLTSSGGSDEWIYNDQNIAFDNNVYWDWNFNVTGAANAAGYMCIGGTTADQYGGGGYGVWGRVGEAISLRSACNGGDTIVDSGITVSSGTSYSVRVWRRTDGNWSLYVNGDYKGSGVETTRLDMNHVIFSSGGIASTFKIGDFNILTFGTVNQDKNEVHSFSTPGTKTVCLTGVNTDGSATTCHDLNITSAIKLSFYDENTATQFAPTTVSVNGASQSLDGNALVFNLSTYSTPTNLTILASDANHYQRTFYFKGVTSTYSIDQNVVLLDNNKGQLIEFQWYRPDKVNPISNSLISMIRTLNGYQYLAGLIQTDNDGKGSFFVQTDGNYRVDIDSGGDGSSDYNYIGTIVTIPTTWPKNEVTLASIGDYNLVIGGLASQTYENLSSTSAETFLIFTDTVSTYNFVFSKLGYLARNYFTQTKGGEPTYVLKPYLIDSGSGGQVIIYTVDPYAQNKTISGVTIQIYRNLIGSEELMETTLSDSSGTAAISLVANASYTVKAYYLGFLVYQGTLNGLFTSYTLYIVSLSAGQNKLTPTNFANVSFSPTTSLLDENSNYTFIVSVDANATLSQVRVSVGQDSNILCDQTWASIMKSNLTVCSLDMNSLATKSPIKVSVYLQFNDANTSFSSTYFIGQNYGTFPNIVTATNNWLKEIPFIGRALLALIITIAIVGFFTFSGIGVDTNSLGILTVTCLVFFGYAGFFATGKVVNVPGLTWDTSWAVILVCGISTMMLMRMKRV